MKILIPILKFCPSGGYRVLSELANHWIDMGHEVVFLSHLKSDKPHFPTSAGVVWFDNKGKIVSENNLNTKTKLFNYFALTFSMIKAINAQSADIIMANHSLTALPVSLSIIKAKKFYYIQAYEPYYFESLKSIKGLFLKFVSKLSYYHDLNKIVNSPLYFNYKEIKSKMLVYPGLDFSIFKPLLIKKHTDTFIIGCIGRIEPYKGTSYVLEAFRLLKKNTKIKVELHIAFGNPLIVYEEGVIIKKIAGDKELANFYNSLNILIAPGTYQLGAVHYPVIEAMACKIPVITTGYLPADNSNSWIVPTKNSQMIYNKILEIYYNNDETLEKVEKAFLDIQEFDWKIVSPKMILYFQNLG